MSSSGNPMFEVPIVSDAVAVQRHEPVYGARMRALSRGLARPTDFQRVLGACADLVARLATALGYLKEHRYGEPKIHFELSGLLVAQLSSSSLGRSGIIPTYVYSNALVRFRRLLPA